MSAFTTPTKAQKLWMMNNLKQQTMEWISVKDRLPELGIEVIISNKLYGRGIGYCISPNGSFKCTILGTQFTEEEPNVTHWMPLPNPPSNE